MRTFDEIFKIAAERKGGAEALETLLEPPLSSGELRAVSDDRWLSGMARSVFQAGFNWKVVERMWPAFEEIFERFDPGYCAMLNDDQLAELLSNRKIIRNGTKLRSVQENAVFVTDLAREHGSAATFFADWPSETFNELLEAMKKRGSRLGGATAQYFLRSMGRDGYILSQDVTARLIAEGVIEKPPGSKTSMKQVQDAFNLWQEQSGRSLKEISRVLAMSTG